MNKQGQEPFILVELFNESVGILKVDGPERNFVANIWSLPGADAADNEWLIARMKETYEQYYYRVKSYKEDV